MAKLVLADLDNLQNEPTAVGTINSNSALIEVALENTLSRDGTSPNTMGATLDMNTNRIINLPAPVANNEPLRKQELLDFVGGSVNLYYYPIGGTTNQSLIKNSNTDYDVKWGNPPASSLSNGTTGSGTVVLSTSPTITTPIINTSLTVFGAGSGVVKVDSASADSTMFLLSKGAGNIYLTAAGQTTATVSVVNSPSFVNGIVLQGAIATATPAIYPTGTDTDVNLYLTAKGSGKILLGTWTSVTGSLQTPTIYGSYAAGTQYLVLATTAGAGSSDQIWLKGGNNGGTSFAVVDANGIESFKSVKATLTDGYKLGTNKVIDAVASGTGYYTTVKDYTGTQFFSVGAGGTGADYMFIDKAEAWFRASGGGNIYGKFQANGLNLLRPDDATSSTTGTLTSTGGISAVKNIYSGAYLYAISGIGYPTGVGAGGTVTQSTNKTTAVTINKPTGEIITHNQALGAGAITAFLVNNSFCTGQDIVLMSVHNAPTMGAYSVNVNAGGSSFTVYLRNNTGGSLSENVTLRYTIIKSAQN